MVGTSDRAVATLRGGAVSRSGQLLWRGLRSQPLLFGLGIAGSALYGAATVGAGWLLGRATDQVVVPAVSGVEIAAREIWLAAGSLAAVAVVNAVSVVARRAISGAGVFHLQAQHRRAVTRQYLRLPISWHRRHPAGQLLSNASSDVEAATNVFMPLPFALGVLVMLIIAAWAMLSADTVLGLAGLVVIPGIVATNVVYQRRMSPLVTKAQQLRAEVADVAHESFDGALIVKSLGLAEHEQQRFAGEADRLRGANVAVGRARAVFDPVMEALPTLATLLVLAVGAVRVAAGAVQAGDVVTAAYLLTVMAFPVRAFGFVLGELPRGLVGWERIARVLDATDRLATGEEQFRKSGPAAVSVTDVHVTYRDAVGDETRVLRGVNLTIEPGRTVALVGATGAGKSTLANLLVRLGDPTTGSIAIDGVDLRDLDAAQLARAAALVAQEAFLFDDTVRGNITLADIDDGPSDDEVIAALTAARAWDFVSQLPQGLDTVVGERGASLSGGQRQRIALARALIRSPRLLILDDATSAVDPEIERDILAAIRNARAGATVILVAYRLATITSADEVIHLRDGKVASRGTHWELLERDPDYRALVTAYERDAAERAK